MPRKTPYQPWSSKNCRLLQALENYDAETAVVWRTPDKTAPAKDGEEARILHSEKGAAGRPHREEAVLIQKAGEVNEKPCTKCARQEGAFTTCVSVRNIHRGACGNCVWDSKQIDCTLDTVLENLEAEINVKEKQDDLKARKKNVRGGVSSKAARVRPDAKGGNKKGADKEG